MKYSVYCSAHSGGHSKDCNEKLAVLGLDAGVKLADGQGERIDGYLCEKCSAKEWKDVLPFAAGVAAGIMDFDEATRIANLRRHFLITGNKQGLENLALLVQQTFFQVPDDPRRILSGHSGRKR